MFVRRLAVNFVVLLVLCFSVETLISAQQYQVLKNHVPASVKQMKPAGRVPGPKRLNLILALPLRNQEQLEKLLEQIYDPAHPNFHHYLTAAQFAERFGPTDEDYRAVIRFASSHGFKVTGTHPNRTLLDVNGSAGEIEKAFHINLRVYQHPTEARTFHAPDADPSVDLLTPLLDVNGLDDYVLPRPMNLKAKPFPYSSDQTPYASGSGPRETFIGNDFRKAYAPGVTQTGSGQAVGLLEFDGYFPGDISTYKGQSGLPNVPIRNVLLDGVDGSAGGYNFEVALDIDMALSMAPGLSEVIVYEGFFANDILNRMATDNQARQLSSSWGYGPQTDPTRRQILQQFAAQGQTMFQASGDLGAWTAQVAPPSDDPWLTIVGGTSLSVTTNGEWESETTWPSSGGGISSVYPIPDWQKGIDMSANQGSVSMRNIPDVAAMADFGIWLVADNGDFYISGGTSASAPLWAGFAALANEGASTGGKPALGFLNPTLYSIGKEINFNSNFHDITTGDNINNNFGKFSAVPGYDLCTGWGTPTGSNLVAALITPPGPLRITPADGATFVGPVGGPINPASKIYTLTNTGTLPLTWSLLNTASWLSPSTGSGTLAPGGPAYELILTPNSGASNQPPGLYSGTLWFTNLNDQSWQSREMTLAIVSPPVITAQPESQAALEGADARFSVGTASNAFLFYQWRKDNGGSLTNLNDGGNIFGATNSTLIISNVSSMDVGQYSVVVSNAAGVALSSNASLTIVSSRPVIVEQPANQTLLAGETLRLRVEAIGSQPLSFQWLRNGTNLLDGGNISGSATSNLSIENVSAGDAGVYSVFVTNRLGSAVSSNAFVAIESTLSPGTALARIYSFSGGTDGTRPNGLMRATNGIFYGTASSGGTNGAGTIFQLTPSGVVTPLYSLVPAVDGANPFAPLMEGVDGNLYGTAFQGGAFDLGTVFRTTPQGAFAPLVSLNVTNGDFPYAGLISSDDGFAYGTTYKGGGAFGTIYKLSTNGVLTTLYSFSGGNDGGLVYAGLTEGLDGNLYGTTFKGGQYDFGTVFRSTKAGFLTTVVSFNNTNGSFPYAGLARDTHGNLFGVTSGGGVYTNGTVFKISSNGVLTNLYSFTGGTDGANPAATLLAANDGNFYGSTVNGGTYGKGTLFRISPNGTFITLAQFDGFNGANPAAPLVEGTSGEFFGTAPQGGAMDQGVIFQVNFAGPARITTQPDNQTVYSGASVSFSVAVSGTSPIFYQWRLHGTNLADGGNVFGSSTRVLTITNVSPANAGFYSVLVSNSLRTVQSADASLAVIVSPPFFTLQPTNQVLPPGDTAVFAANAQGNVPLTYQWQTNGINLTDGGNLRGANSSTLIITNLTEANNGIYSVVVSNSLGAISSTGAVLTVIPFSYPGTLATSLHWFAGGTNGRIPNGLSRGTNGLLYGTTQYGGAHLAGTAFSIATNGIFTTLGSFDGIHGSVPTARLTQGANGKLYGTTRFGGDFGYGTVFEMDSGGAISNLYMFTGEADGGNPVVGVIQATDGNFYGASTGVSDLFGNVFKLTPDGMFANLHSFTGGTDGDNAAGELLQGQDGKFYGLSSGGGAKAAGTVFELTSSGDFSTVYSFSGQFDGYAPEGALVQGTDGNLFGVTAHNRIRNFEFYGTLFKVTTNGALATLYPLNYGDGSFPAAGLMQSSDGNFYGTTEFGGYFGNGTVFRLSPNGAFTKLVDLDGLDLGAHPMSALVEGPDGSIYGTSTEGGPGGRGTIFKISITSPPLITAQPLNQSVLAGGNCSFSVAVFAAPPISYQWQKNGTNLIDGPNIFGSTNRVLRLSNVQAQEAGSYSVSVRNSLDTATSAAAVLTVIPLPLFQTISRVSGIVNITWASAIGQTYQLQYQTSLLSGAWINLGGSITSTGTLTTASDPINPGAQRFYRVLLLQ